MDNLYKQLEQAERDGMTLLIGRYQVPPDFLAAFVRVVRAQIDQDEITPKGLDELQDDLGMIVLEAEGEGSKRPCKKCHARGILQIGVYAETCPQCLGERYITPPSPSGILPMDL